MACRARVQIPLIPYVWNDPFADRTDAAIASESPTSIVRQRGEITGKMGGLFFANDFSRLGAKGRKKGLTSLWGMEPSSDRQFLQGSCAVAR